MKITKPGRFRRVPPAIFPPLLGMMSLALDWRRAAVTFGVPSQVGQLLAGAVTTLALLALVSYGAKLARRAAVLAEDLRILPGRAGCAAGVVVIYLLAAVFAPLSPVTGKVVLVAAFMAQVALWTRMIPVMTGTPGQGRVTPVWHISFVGPIVGAMAALSLGWDALARLLWFPCAALAVFIWTVSLRQAMSERVPAPLRPILAIHLAPVALLGTVAHGLGMTGIAHGMGIVALAILLVAAVGWRWLTAAGFTPLWGAFTFPLAASAGLMLLLATEVSIWRYPAALVLVVATLLVPMILYRIWRAWADGNLAVKSNAAEA